MTEETLESIFYAAIDRIQGLEASKTDLALVFIMSEFIDALGGSKAAQIHVIALEATWKKAQGEYKRGVF